MEQLTEKKEKSAKREEGGDWLGHEDDWRFKEARHLKARLSLSHLDVGQLHPAEYVGGARSDYGVRSDTMLESRRSAGVAATQPGRVYTRPVAHAINVQTASMVIPFPLFGQRQCSPAPAAISRNTGRSRPPCIMHKRHEDHLLGRTERCGRLAVIDLDYEIATTILSTRRKSRDMRRRMHPRLIFPFPPLDGFAKILIAREILRTSHECFERMLRSCFPLL